TVVLPVICRASVGTPPTHVPFRIPIPLGARRHLLDLFHFLARVSCSSAVRGGNHRCEGTNRNGKLLHVSPFGSPLYNQKQDGLIVNNVLRRRSGCAKTARYLCLQFGGIAGISDGKFLGVERGSGPEH